MKSSIEELRTGIGVLLAHGDARTGTAYQDRVELSDQNSGDYQYRQPTEGDIPHSEILAMFDRTVSELHATFERHSRPFNKTDGIESHAHGACTHIRVSYYRSALDHFPGIEVHVFSNAPRMRLCLRCARNERNAERYQCTTCGQPNPRNGSKLRRRQAVLISEYYEPPMHFYVPMCDNCRLILAHNGYGRPLFFGPPLAGMTNGRGAL